VSRWVSFFICVLAVASTVHSVAAEATSPLTPRSPQSGVVQAPALTDSTWQWLSTRHNPGPRVVAQDPSRYTVTFMSDGTLTVRADCNQVSGTYSVQPVTPSGAEIQGLTIQLGASTLAACPPDSQDSVFLADLAAASSYRFRAHTLVLNLQASGNRMTLAPLAPASLVGTNWQAVAYNNGRGGVTSVMLGSVLTASFSADGIVAGNAGCNTYNGSYTAEGDTLSIGPIATTRMVCEASLLEQEQAFLAALQATSRYTLASDRLTLRDAGGAIQAEFTTTAASP
jgi:heat shock protein HslJ